MTAQPLLVSPLLTGNGDSSRLPGAERWTLNRPAARNALDPGLVEALHEALRRAEQTGTQVVVIDGQGQSFCAGADLHFLRSHDPRRSHTPRPFLERIWDLTIAMENSPVVFVAAVHGHVVAGGLELALACDVVLAAATTMIGDGHVINNLLPGGGASARLERALGRGPSSWLALTGALLPADHKAFTSWLHSVVEDDALETTVEEVVLNLLRAAPVARARFKRLLNRHHSVASRKDRDAELDAFDQHWIDSDVPQALGQFLESKKKGKAS